MGAALCFSVLPFGIEPSMSTHMNAFQIALGQHIEPLAGFEPAPFRASPLR